MTADSTSEREKLKEETLKKEIAEMEKATVEANLAKLKAQIPSGETKPLEGKTTIDEKSGYIADIAAYNAMTHSSETIANKIDSLDLGKNAHILIVDSLDFSSMDVQLLQVSKQLEMWENQLNTQMKRIKELMPPPPTEKKPEVEEVILHPAKMLAAAPLITLLPDMIKAAADIIGYFKMDYNIQGRVMTLSDIALRSLVSGRINKYSVYLPAFHRISLPKEKKDSVIDKYNKCVEKRNELKLEMSSLKSQVIDHEPKETGQAKKEPSQAKNVYDQSDAVIAVFDEFSKALVSIPQGKTYSPLASAAIQEHLEQIPITHLLYLTVISGGGQVITSRGLFLWGKVSYLGGCVISYILADCSGKVIAADTLPRYSSIRICLCKILFCSSRSAKKRKEETGQKA